MHYELSNVRCARDSSNCWGLVFEIGVVFEESNPCCDDLTDGLVGRGGPGAREALTVVGEAR